MLGLVDHLKRPQYRSRHDAKHSNTVKLRRPTLKDLAKAAGVGLATVDRVLNERPGVSAAAIDSVLAAAERIGYPTAKLEAIKLDATRPLVRFGFVLHKPSQEFYRNFAKALETAVSGRTDIRGRCDVRFAASQSPSDFASELTAVAETTDVVATSAINHPTVSDAIRALQERGKPVFSLLNDAASGVQQSYFGLDNVKVGRIAGWMIGTQSRAPGKVAVFIGGNRWHGHILRETGLRSYLRDHAPHLDLSDATVNLETRQVTYEATLDLLDRHPDLRGIYVAGGGMEGAIAALREARPPGKVALIVNELTAESRQALTDRIVSLVIATPLDQLCRALIASMIEAARGDRTAISGQHYLVPQLYSPESL
ncbi:LacI family DNA-binding transcriptional regulator [Salipiger sp. IMCC34102]|uniref:LacI family DNA-binding transcriptional regulator n=1 Tax=Salipiger sp. IMCC34102 TaxID=2510647 RepID=UPI00101CCB86|nr:LacI family DNA-binding transcriptional regulator [Salipiger sp. IMCC34102]RYH02105.1 LacI family DNA-binding transcriptional regulator [Salipiger sp. IMCC34102]